MPSTNPEAPTPDPGPQPLPPTTVPPMPEGPVCGACGATLGGERFGASWRRRLTDDELAKHIAEEQEKRDRILLLADPQLPPPVFKPLPDGSDDTVTLYACGDHTIDKDLASHIHQKTCTAPNEQGQWGCDCTPEPHPEARNTALQDLDEETAPGLPEHWTAGA